MVASVKLRPSIFLFGDSLTQQGFGEDGSVGWASLLASAYTRRADVLNRGFSGYNTRHALEILPEVLAPKREERTLFCTVLLGANDATIPGHRQHVPVEEYSSNLSKIVTTIKEEFGSENFPVILMTPPPVDSEKWMNFQGDSEPDRNNVASEKYGAACKKVAEEHQCPCLDVFVLLGGDGDDYSKHLNDGLHLTGSGNTLIFDGLMNLLKTEYPDIAPMEGDGKTEKTGIPVEHKLWRELC